MSQITNGGFPETDEEREPGNIYRPNADGEMKVHVMAEDCDNCLFHPDKRLVNAARVKELVAETKDEPGASFVCHLADLNHEQATCAGWFRLFGDRDPIFRMAVAMDVIERVEVAPLEKKLGKVTPQGGRHRRHRDPILSLSVVPQHH